MMRIEEHKKRLIEQRRWADRNDQVDPLTVEWMRERDTRSGSRANRNVPRRRLNDRHRNSPPVIRTVYATIRKP